MVQRPRGKKPRACDRCARLRRACTGFQPCRTCARFRLICTYNRIRHRTVETNASAQRYHITSPSFQPEENDEAGLVPVDASVGLDAFVYIAGQDQIAISALRLQLPEAIRMQCISTETEWLSSDDAMSTDDLLFQDVPHCLLFPRPTDMDLHVLKTFPFFRRMASSDGLGNIFECGDVSQRNVIACELDAPSSQPFADGAITPSHFVDIGSSNSLSNNSDAGSGDLELLCLSAKIISSVTHRGRCDQAACKHHSNYKETLMTACRLLFSSQCLRRYLSLYWTCWHPNWPVIHQPSFSITAAPPTLVAAMAVIGACLSTVEEDRTLAKVVFDSLEDAVFCHEIFSDYQHVELEENLATPDLREQLDILIAAYCICLYQTWEGGKTAKRRVRRQRFNQMICVCVRLTSSGRFRSTKTRSWLVTSALIPPLSRT